MNESPVTAESDARPLDAAPPAETSPVDDTIPLADLAELIAIDVQRRHLRQRLGELAEMKMDIEDKEAQAKSQLAEIHRKQQMEHARLMKRYNIVEGSRIDFETGKVTAP